MQVATDTDPTAILYRKVREYRFERVDEIAMPSLPRDTMSLYRRADYVIKVGDVISYLGHSWRCILIGNPFRIVVR